MSNSKQFEVVFDARSHLWEDEYAYNKLMTRSTLVNLTLMFQANGFLFVRTIYERFGMPITKESITAGWHENGSVNKFVVDDIVYNGDSIVIIFKAEEDIREYF